MVCALHSAHAAYPERPIRMLVPFAPGVLAAELVANALPNCHTLLVGSSGILAIAPGMNDKLPYYPIKSFETIALISNVSLVLVVRTESAVRSVRELIALSKSKPDPLNMASSGNFSTGQLAGVLFQNRTGTHFTHIPYKGASLAATDIIGGHVDLMFDQISSAIGNLRSGRLRPRAVTSVAREPDLPDVPTMKEAGAEGVDAGTFTAMLAPLHTPRDIVVKLNQTVNAVLKLQATHAAFARLGASTMDGTPDQARKYIQGEFDKWSAVLRTIKDK